MLLETAQALAGEIVALLTPACSKIEVAGSTRRLKYQVGDIEIVAMPSPEPGFDSYLFKDISPIRPQQSTLEILIADLKARGVLAADPDLKRNGPRAKRLLFKDTPIDLFIADNENYGCILAIRTGDASFSHRLVTSRRDSGYMPAYLRQKGGYLWHGSEIVPCPTEEDYFAALELQWIAPVERIGTEYGKLARLLLGGRAK